MSFSQSIEEESFEAQGLTSESDRWGDSVDVHPDYQMVGNRSADINHFISLTSTVCGLDGEFSYTFDHLKDKALFFHYFM
jgi:hypothetical protein